jgi:hypothetical protein
VKNTQAKNTHMELHMELLGKYLLFKENNAIVNFIQSDVQQEGPLCLLLYLISYNISQKKITK